MGTPADERAARLKAALRANLKRRKAAGDVPATDAPDQRSTSPDPASTAADAA